MIHPWAHGESDSLIDKAHRCHFKTTIGYFEIKKINQKNLTKSKQLIHPSLFPIHILLPFSSTTLGNHNLPISDIGHCNSVLSSLLSTFPKGESVLNTGYSFQSLALLMPFSSKSSSGSPLIWHPRQTMS